MAKKMFVEILLKSFFSGFMNVQRKTLKDVILDNVGFVNPFTGSRESVIFRTSLLVSDHIYYSSIGRKISKNFEKRLISRPTIIPIVSDTRLFEHKIMLGLMDGKFSKKNLHHLGWTVSIWIL